MGEGFGGVAYQNVTNIHPISIVAILILGIFVLCVPRRWSVIPILCITCFIPLTQKISILSMDFNILRIMVLIGTMRLIIRKDYLNFVWKPLDTAVLLWTFSMIVIYILQQRTSAAVINRLGFGYDSIGMYFLFRSLIRNWTDINYLIFGAILISIPVAVFFVIENRTGRNLFSIFGGVPSITVMRHGRLRCQGAFNHPIIAGCFWASLAPLFAAYWWKSFNDRIWAAIGVVCAVLIVFCSASSTPVLALICGLIGGLCFYLRYQMRIVRWSILLILVALHLVMNGPVWHLISRISAVGGSTGYFRYKLIDSAISHFNEWALLGTKSTAHWFWGAQDLCNYYVYQGVMGGFLTLCLFVAVLVIAYREVGRLWKSQIHSSYYLALSWAMGVSLFVHCANFIGVAYIGTITILWYLLLGIIGSFSIPAKALRI